MSEVFANAQRARFGQSSEQKNYVLGKDQHSLFDEAEEAQNHKTEELLIMVVVWSANHSYYNGEFFLVYDTPHYNLLFPPRHSRGALWYNQLEIPGQL